MSQDEGKSDKNVYMASAWVVFSGFPSTARRREASMQSPLAWDCRSKIKAGICLNYGIQYRKIQKDSMNKSLVTELSLEKLFNN